MNSRVGYWCALGVIAGICGCGETHVKNGEVLPDEVAGVWKAQGKGCAPGVIGVGVGGDRVTSFALSKKQFFRKIGERHSDPQLADMEKKLYQDLNKLDIGPMGFGGKTTVLDVFIDAQHRHPASFFVSVSYTCWAFRRKSMTIKNNEVTYD